MAKRPSSNAPDPFDNDPFDDEIDSGDDIDNLRLSAEDLDDSGVAAVLESEGDPTRALGQTREPITPGRFIVGAIKVIVIAVIALAIFLALSFGAIYGGQKVGLVPTRSSGSGLLISLLATPVPQTAAPPTAVAAQPTAAPQNAQSAPTNAPAAQPTTVPGCPSATAWWNSQQIQSAYQYFTQQALNDVRSGSQPLAALLNQMGIHASFVQNYRPNNQPLDACINDALNALVQDFDAITDVARVLGSSDQSTLTQTEAAADQAAAKLIAALWNVGVNLDSSAAMPDPSTKDQGGSCGAQTWYTAVKPHVDAFNQAAAKLNPASGSGNDAKNLISTMQAERGNVNEVSAPSCATQAQQVLLAALDSDVQAYQTKLAGNDATSALATYAQDNQLFLAWQQWLGIG